MQHCSILAAVTIMFLTVEEITFEETMYAIHNMKLKTLPDIDGIPLGVQRALNEQCYSRTCLMMFYFLVSFHHVVQLDKFAHFVNRGLRLSQIITEVLLY